jgi:hypothetical protein
MGEGVRPVKTDDQYQERAKLMRRRTMPDPLPVLPRTPQRIGGGADRGGVELESKETNS